MKSINYIENIKFKPELGHYAMLESNSRSQSQPFSIKLKAIEVAPKLGLILQRKAIVNVKIENLNYEKFS
jgi:hypothetical protein